MELIANKIEIVGTTDDSYPLQKRGIAGISSRNRSSASSLKSFSSVFACGADSRFSPPIFQERGFIYVHTPIITGSDCEGAGEYFA